MFSARLDRQLLIDDWDQEVLAASRMGVVGDSGRLASLFILAAAALGLNRLVVLAPGVDGPLLEMARRLNPDLELVWVEGFYTHPLLGDIFQGCKALVDLSRYGLANKLLLERGRREDVPVIRGFTWADAETAGFKIFTYRRGREWRELGEVVSPRNLPHHEAEDPVLAIIAAGLVLEEAKNVFMGRKVSGEVIRYQRPSWNGLPADPAVAVVGAGALGNFVALGLAYSGYRNLTFLDPDTIDVTNLNRQVFFYEAVGQSKAEVLAGRLNRAFGLQARAVVDYVKGDIDLTGFDIIFDCVDNFETRIVLSERCGDLGKILISGGSGVDSGQVVVYDPQARRETPAALLGLADLVGRRQPVEGPRHQESCRFQPDPSVIMTNQIIAGFMVESLNRLLTGQEVPDIFYDARADRKF